jgi:hypothetical protein
MTAVATPLPFRRLSRRQRTILVMIVAGVAALLYLEWRSVRTAPPGDVADQDTMCMASRIGLESLCR